MSRERKIMWLKLRPAPFCLFTRQQIKWYLLRNPSKSLNGQVSQQNYI